MDIGTKIPVVVYDTKNRTYTVANATISYDYGSNSFKILQLGNTPTGAYEKGTVTEQHIREAELDEMKNSSHTAAEALAVYNALVAGSSQ